MKNFLFILLIAISTMSCNNKESDMQLTQSSGIQNYSPSAEASVDEATVEEPSSSNNQVEVKKENHDIAINKKIIKDGRIGIEVSDLVKSKALIDTLIKKKHGYYAGENFQNSDFESTINLTIRIPNKHFESFVASVEEGEGKILYKELVANDVTEQFVDLQIRLENKHNYLLRYRDLLKKAKSVKEILEIEEHIRVLEEEIESVEGKLRYMNDLVDYSTLNLQLSKKNDYKFEPEKQKSFVERLKQSVSKGWFGFVNFILLLFRIWPFWFVAALLIYLWRKFKRRKKL